MPSSRVLQDDKVYCQVCQQSGQSNSPQSFERLAVFWYSVLALIMQTLPPYGGMAYCVNIQITQNVNEHPRAISEAGDGTRPPRSAAAGGSLFLPALARRLSLFWVILGGWRIPEGLTRAAATGIQRSNF